MPAPRAILPSVLLLVALLAPSSGCHRSAPPPLPADAGADAEGHSAPTAETIAANAAVASALPLDDQRDFEEARRGLLGGDGDVVITGHDGHVVWDTSAYTFIDGTAPPTVNPSLWRQAKLNNLHGLFKVTDGVYQVRGYDLSNMTLIRGQSGWIVVDPLTARETAAAALALARQHLDAAPIVAVIFTHSHIDHFGGVRAVLPEDANAPRPRLIAPHAFVEEATSENVLAGLAMGRRAAFMYGTPLARGPRGHVDTGLGKAPARGSLGFAVPLEYIDHTPQEMTIDGVRFVFQHVPDSEAPAELAFYLPDLRAYCGAEIVSHTQHNLYTLRGAKVRDALRWSDYIDEALVRFPDAEIVFASHHWPVWGSERVKTYLAEQRDVYRYIHDQTLRLANGGATPREIAEQLELPESLRTAFNTRGYYGTVSHNAKAVYQNYFGWYDGNPANLDPLPPVDEARRYVDAMGGAAAVRAKASEAFAKGDYRWAATLLNHAVFADPDDGAARALLARTYDQLGYQAESGPWRDIYLSGATELRHGITKSAISPRAAAELLGHVPPATFLTAIAASLDGPAAADASGTFNFIFTDVDQSFVLSLQHGVLHHRAAPPDPQAAATVRLTRALLVRLVTGDAGLRDLVFSDELAVDGSRLELLGFLRLLARPDGDFALVTP
ncbi:MAG: alkyl sulfatase dimerization domain-containing protein [Deltaproteobacteria bacterium]|nr:alkyl sulfatase dimerization domain-containing protein [Deltaproteobacteria bacterium]